MRIKRIGKMGKGKTYGQAHRSYERREKAYLKKVAEMAHDEGISFDVALKKMNEKSQ